LNENVRSTLFSIKDISINEVRYKDMGFVAALHTITKVSSSKTEISIVQRLR
jgi:hypothetical protein